MRCFVSLALVSSSLFACGSRTALDAPAPAPVPVEGGCADVSGTLRITADDQYRAWVNGVLVDDAERKWWEVRSLAVRVRRSRNTLAIEATNRWSQDGIDRGLIADLELPGGVHVITSPAWRVSTTRVAGWETTAFDASAWKPAFSEGANGIAPYGAVLGASKAEWLWSRSSNVPMSQKPNEETIWLRFEFSIDCR